MNQILEPAVGSRIRFLREEQGLSLRALAERSGLSLNAISRIEKGDNSPTVSSLHQLARALGVTIVDLFEREDERSTVFLKKEHRLSSEVSGVTMESLGSGLRNQQLEPFLISLAPGAGNVQEPITHEGEECVYCLSGCMDYCIGTEVYHLEAGSSLLFDASQPHAFCNPTENPAVVLLVFQAKGDLDVARQRHLDVQKNDHG